MISIVKSRLNVHNFQFQEEHTHPLYEPAPAGYTYDYIP